MVSIDAVAGVPPSNATVGQLAMWDETVHKAKLAAQAMDVATATLIMGTLRGYFENVSTIPDASSAPAEPPAPVQDPAQAQKVDADAKKPTPDAVAKASDAFNVVSRLSHSPAAVRSRERLNPERSVEELQERHGSLLVIRALISTFATLLLAVLAMKTLYVPGFGESILQYAAVLVSGFGAGVAGKGLSTSLTASSFGP